MCLEHPKANKTDFFLKYLQNCVSANNVSRQAAIIPRKHSTKTRARACLCTVYFSSYMTNDAE